MYFVTHIISVTTDLFYGGESHSVEQPLSFTCPLCAQLGFSETQLREHVTKQHGDSGGGQEVICPVCASHPSGDPNHVTDDLPSHLTMEHRPPRDFELVISRLLPLHCTTCHALVCTFVWLYRCARCQCLGTGVQMSCGLFHTLGILFSKAV